MEYEPTAAIFRLEVLRFPDEGLGAESSIKMNLEKAGVHQVSMNLLHWAALSTLAAYDCVHYLLNTDARSRALLGDRLDSQRYATALQLAEKMENWVALSMITLAKARTSVGVFAHFTPRLKEIPTSWIWWEADTTRYHDVSYASFAECGFFLKPYI